MKKYKILFLFMLKAIFVLYGLLLFLRFMIIDTELTITEYFKKDKKVVFVEMIHVGNNGFYSKVSERFNHSKYTILTEGVTDNKKILNDKTSVFSLMKNFSKVLLLKYQPSEKEMFNQANVVNSDIDISELPPRIVLMLSIGYRNGYSLSENDINKYLLDFRNEKIMNNINNSKSNNIVVPWGRKHHIGLQKMLLENGYQVSKKEKIKENSILVSIREDIGRLTSVISLK